LDETIFNIWWSNARAYLRHRGILLIFGFTTEDNYYSQFDIIRSGSFLISKDTITGIDKRLDSPEFIKSYFSERYSIQIEKVKFPDFVLGKLYHRDILLSVLRLKPHII
jgi:hypothetical protein